MEHVLEDREGLPELVAAVVDWRVLFLEEKDVVLRELGKASVGSVGRGLGCGFIDLGEPVLSVSFQVLEDVEGLGLGVEIAGVAGIEVGGRVRVWGILGVEVLVGVGVVRGL